MCCNINSRCLGWIWDGFQPVGPGEAVAAGVAQQLPHHGMDHVLAGICAVSIAEKHSVSIAVCYRYFMHMEAPIKNKNILKPVKKKIVQILLLVCFSGDVWLSHGVDPSRS